MNLTEISVSRTVQALPEEVFDVWMDPGSPGGPWFDAERTILNPFVDGLFYQSVSYAGRSWHHYGRFIKIDRPHVIQHTWVSEATKGLESIVLVAFKRSGAATEVTLRQTGIPDDELGRRHKEGGVLCSPSSPIDLLPRGQRNRPHDPVPSGGINAGKDC